jgi:TPR repeat protein
MVGRLLCVLLLIVLSAPHSGHAGELFDKFSRAAESGDSHAQAILGAMYLSGREVAKDTDKGLWWINKSAEAGNANGQFLLGVWYEKQEKNIQLAKHWYLKSAKQGHATARSVLELIVFKELKEASDAGDLAAQEELLKFLSPSYEKRSLQQ